MSIERVEARGRAGRRPLPAALVVAGLAAVLWGWTCGLAPPVAAAADSGPAVSPPLAPMQVLRAFAPPAQPWLAGNRGVDLAAFPGQPVHAVAAGRVLYAGLLAGRGVVSIRHAALRTTYEPVVPTVRAGQVLARGDVIGYVANTADSCGPPGHCLHWGAIRAGAYVDPMALLATAHVRLLPIWRTAGPTEARAQPSQQPLILTPRAAPTAAAPIPATRSDGEPATRIGRTTAGAAGAVSAADTAGAVGAASAAGAVGAAGGVLLTVALRRRRGTPP